jgi:peroxiredoxin
MYPDLRKAGVELIAVNAGDDLELVNEFMKSGGFTIPVVVDRRGDGRVCTSYGAFSFPTNFVINKDGVVVDTILGFDENRLKAALKKIGVMLSGKSSDVGVSR